jgi:hypothetical protein
MPDLRFVADTGRMHSGFEAVIQERHLEENSRKCQN